MKNSRRRNIAILGAAAFVSLALAAFGLKQKSDEGQPHYAPTTFLPGFAAEVAHAARIHIVSHSDNFDIVYSPDKGWTVPARGGYPADLDEVRHTLIGLATLQTIEPKTARPDWYGYAGVEMPPNGNGVLIIVSDAQGRTLASLIAGNMEDIGDTNGAAGLFVRRPDEKQSWLTRAVFVPHGEIAPWMLSHVMDIDAARLKDISVAAPSRNFTLSRAHPSDQNYAISPSAKTANQSVANIIPTLITSFGFTDVRPLSGMDFTKAFHVIAHTFDGLTILLTVTADSGQAWAQLSASAAPNAAPAIAEEARAIDARAAGWAYKLNPDKARLLMIDPSNPGNG